jgi:hypothetical protein
LTGADPVINLTSGWAFAFVVAIAGLVVVATYAVLWLNHRAAVRVQRQVAIIIGSDPNMYRDYSAADKGALIASVHAHTGARGTTRTVIALLVMALAGVALAATLVSGASDAQDLRKTIITALLTFLAVIGGFYFGTRAVQDSQVGTPVQPSNGTAAAKITALPTVAELVPAEGAAGAPVTITGSGLASAATAVNFGTVTGVKPVSVSPGGTTMQVQVPAGSGEVDVTVTTLAGTSATGPNTKFTYN